VHEQHGGRDHPGSGTELDIWGSGTAKIMWDATKWVALDQFQAGLPYTVMGIIKSRLITLLKLQSIKTDGFGWFVDTHLAVNIPNEEAIRQQQIRRAITLIEQRPDHERVIFFGDFNSVPTNASVRKIASDAGYKHLRAKLSASLITRRTCNTFNGWKITKRESKWIDDVLTSPAARSLCSTAWASNAERRAACLTDADSSHLRSSTPAFYSVLSPSDDLSGHHRPLRPVSRTSPRFEIRCATHT
jgi:hypothetical protein